MSTNPGPAQNCQSSPKTESCLAQREQEECRLKETQAEAAYDLTVVDDKIKEEQRERLKADMQMAARHTCNVDSKPSAKQKQHLLNILANPAATESEWMRAVHILGDYQHNPQARKKNKRMALLLLIGLSAAGILTYCGYDNGILPGFKKPHPVVAQVDVDFGPYMAQVQRRVKRNWFPPAADISKKVVLRWKIYKDGHIGNVTLYSSSGIEALDDSAVAAVVNSGRFEPLPAGASNDVDLEFTFDYNVLANDK